MEVEARRIRRFVPQRPSHRTILPLHASSSSHNVSNTISCWYCDYKICSFNRPLFHFGRRYARFLKVWFSIGVGFALSAVLGVTLVPGLSLSLADTGYACVSTIISVFMHELGHAVAATSEGIQVEYIAVFIAILFPGALVAFNYEFLQTLPHLTALRVYSAGIWHNAVDTDPDSPFSRLSVFLSGTIADNHVSGPLARRIQKTSSDGHGSQHGGGQLVRWAEKLPSGEEGIEDPLDKDRCSRVHCPNLETYLSDTDRRIHFEGGAVEPSLEADAACGKMETHNVQISDNWEAKNDLHVRKSKGRMESILEIKTNDLTHGEQEVETDCFKGAQQHLYKFKMPLDPSAEPDGPNSNLGLGKNIPDEALQGLSIDYTGLNSNTHGDKSPEQVTNNYQQLRELGSKWKVYSRGTGCRKNKAHVNNSNTPCKENSHPQHKLTQAIKEMEAAKQGNDGQHAPPDSGPREPETESEKSRASQTKIPSCGMALFLLPMILFPFYSSDSSPMVLNVPPTSPLFGYLAPGDVILSVDNVTIRNAQEWLKLNTLTYNIKLNNVNVSQRSGNLGVINRMKGYCVPSFMMDESKITELLENQHACPSELTAFVKSLCSANVTLDDGQSETDLLNRGWNMYCLNAKDVVKRYRCGDDWGLAITKGGGCTCSQDEFCLAPVQEPGSVWVEIAYSRTSHECLSHVQNRFPFSETSGVKETNCGGTFIFVGDVISMAHSIQLTSYQPRWGPQIVAYFPNLLERILIWTFHVSLALALLNGLPVYFLDGESILDATLSHFTSLSPGKRKKVLRLCLLGGSVISIIVCFRELL
ncbi:hypothetical protein JHK82_044563 [Glycine max]|nr:hypothetical protein JHK82_044563 [Glycine max]